MKIKNPPAAKELMTSARSFGNYSLSSALADIIDNSIEAEAGKISIKFHPEEHDVIVRIRDDGYGMTKDELIAAMKPASTNPEEIRDKSDLGRFGWGLKSASLSQARIITVITWRYDAIYMARWNIDDIDNWEMEFIEGSDAEKNLSEKIITKSGTEVIWSNCDRLTENKALLSKMSLLTHAINEAANDIALTFHRYLQGETAIKKLKIILNGTEILPRDPFLVSNPATQTIAREEIKLHGYPPIYVQHYVLPHFSKLSVNEQNQLGGAEGMIKNQGFYVYRNKRLIIYGTWFKLIKHGELSQLSRVRIDIDNTLDNSWKISVDKSDAQLPSELRVRLKGIIKEFNKKSVKVHRKKGVNLDLPDRKNLWRRVQKNKQISYLINKEHEFYTGMVNSLDKDQEEIFEVYVDLLERGFPVESFLTDVKNDQIDISQGIVDAAEFDFIIDSSMRLFFRSSDDITQSNFLVFIKNTEPFSSHWKYTEDYVINNFNKIIGLE